MAPESPTILFLVNSLCIGGSETKTVRLANALARGGNSVIIAYLNSPTRLLGAISRDVGTVHLQRRGKISPGALRRLVATIRARNVRTVVAVNLYPALYAGLARWWVGAARLRFLAWVNTTEFLTRGIALRMPLYRIALRAADAIIFGADSQRRLWRERYGLGGPDLATAVLYNGVDTEHFAPSSAAQRRSVRANGTAYVIGTVGQMRPEKAQVDLLRATAALRSRGLDVDALIVGDGPERARIEAEIERLDLRGHVELTGESGDVRPHLARMDVFVLTSIAIETFSNAALEAMATGLPIIVSTVGGLRELVAFGGGITYPPGDTARLVESAEALLRDDTRRARLGEEARRAVVEHFSWNRMVDGFLDIASPPGGPGQRLAGRAGA